MYRFYVQPDSVSGDMLEITGTDVNRNNNYYQVLEQQWEKAYERFPEKSVVIFNDIDSSLHINVWMWWKG